MKLKQLRFELDKVAPISNNKIQYEQYTTTSELASQVLFHIQSTHADIEDKLVGDLCCGSGILGVGCSLLGALHVIGMDVDIDCLDIASNNIRSLDIDSMDLINTNLLIHNHHGLLFDTIVMNPPFGTKSNSGIDIQLLNAACKMSKVVYSFHKTSTTEYIKKKAVQFNKKAHIEAHLKFQIKNTYTFHKKTSVDVDVDLIRFY